MISQKEKGENAMFLLGVIAGFGVVTLVVVIAEALF